MPGIFFFGCRLVGSLYYAYICSMKHSSHSSFALLFITASTMLGIVVAERMWLAMPPLAWLLMAVAALVPTLLLGRYKWSQSFLLLVCFFCAGGWLCSWRMDEALVRLPERPVVYEAIVTDTPRPGVYELSVVRMADSTAPLPFKVHAQIAADTRLMVGDGIVAQSRLRGIRRPEGRGEYFSLYLLSHGFSASTHVYARHWHKRRLNTGLLSSVQRFTLYCRIQRKRLLDRALESNLHEEARGMVNAMAMGDRSQLSAEVRDDFSRSGVAHVLALSGLHFGMVYALLLVLLSPWRRRLSAVVAILLALWAYSFLVGLSPSVLRSSSMMTVYALASLAHRERTSVNVLSFVALLLLVGSPLMLFDVGFQLSFASVLSILLFNPLFVHRLPTGYRYYHRISDTLLSVAILSVAAQIGTAPLVAYHFGTFSLYFLLANYVAIPLVTLLVPLALLFFATLGVPVLNNPLAMLLNTLTDWLLGFVHLVQSLPHASFSGLHPPLWLVVTVYAVLAAAYLQIVKMEQKRKAPKPGWSKKSSLW